MKIIDSCIWISLLYKYDSNNKIAETIITDLGEEPFYVTDYIIIEVMTVLLQKVDKLTADGFYDFIKNSNGEILYSDENIFHNFLSFFLDNPYSKLGFIDQSLLYLSKDFEIITFDKKLLQAIEKNTGNS